MTEETEQLLKQREENEQKISELKSKNWDLTIEICRIEGECPRCQNWHYPHC